MFRVAVIGCGAVSKNHGKALSKSGRAKLTYAVDLDRAKAEAFAETYGGEPLTDYRDLYDKGLDAVHVVTPHYTHYPIVMDLLDHGLNVFCEKPLALKPEEAIEMVKKAKAKGLRLVVCFQNRTNSAVREAKEIIADGRYGKIVSSMVLVAWDRHGKYYTESPWRGHKELSGGGTVMNQAIHTLDLLDYLCSGVESVSAVSTNLRCTDDYDVEDSAVANFNMRDGSTAIGFMSNCYPLSKTCDLEIHLEEATLLVNQKGLRISVNGGESVFHEAEVVLTGEKAEWGIGHSILIEEFYRCLETGEKCICDAETGVAAVSIVDRIVNPEPKGFKKVIRWEA